MSKKLQYDEPFSKFIDVCLEQGADPQCSVGLKAFAWAAKIRGEDKTGDVLRRYVLDSKAGRNWGVWILRHCAARLAPPLNAIMIQRVKDPMTAYVLRAAIGRHLGKALRRILRRKCLDGRLALAKGMTDD